MFPEMKDCLPPIHLVPKDFVVPENSGKFYVHVPTAMGTNAQQAQTAVRQTIELWLHDRRSLINSHYPLQQLAIEYLPPSVKDDLAYNNVGYVYEAPGYGNIFAPVHNRAGYHIAEMAALAYIAQTLHHQMTRKRKPISSEYITWQYRIDDALCGMTTSAPLRDVMTDFKIVKSDFENGRVAISFANRNSQKAPKFQVIFESIRAGQVCSTIRFSDTVQAALKDCYENERLSEILA